MCYNKPTEKSMTTIAKMSDGRIVEIVRVSKHVDFSDVVGWICVCLDFQQPERKKQQFKWVQADTRFVWVKEFT
jgi:hypothetical protein